MIEPKGKSVGRVMMQVVGQKRGPRMDAVTLNVVGVVPCADPQTACIVTPSRCQKNAETVAQVELPNNQHIIGSQNGRDIHPHRGYPARIADQFNSILLRHMLWYATPQKRRHIQHARHNSRDRCSKIVRVCRISVLKHPSSRCRRARPQMGRRADPSCPRRRSRRHSGGLRSMPPVPKRAPARRWGGRRPPAEPST